jgi:hypothetical protein
VGRAVFLSCSSARAPRKPTHAPPEGHAYAKSNFAACEGGPSAPPTPAHVAIFRLSVSKVSRGDGRSAVAAAAYRAGEAVREARTGRTHDYRRRRSVVVFRRLVGWDGSRADLWNAAQAAEVRRDAAEAREVQLALPYELPARVRAALALGFAKWLHDRYGCAVDLVIHRPGRAGSDRNHHAHLLLTTRQVSGGGLGRKTRELDDRQQGPIAVELMRARWAAEVNAALTLGGFTQRVENRSAERVGAAADWVHVPRSALGVAEREVPPALVLAAISRRAEANRRRAALRLASPVGLPRDYPEVASAEQTPVKALLSKRHLIGRQTGRAQTRQPRSGTAERKTTPPRTGPQR